MTASFSLAAEDWKEITGFPLQVYPAEAELLQQGAPAREVYFIGHGLVKLICVESDGRELIIGLRSSGWVLGAAPVIIQQPCPVTAITLTKCRLQRLSAKDFLHLAKTDARFSWYLQEMNSREIYDQIARLTQRSLSARRRLEQLIWQLISTQEPRQSPKETRLQLPLKQRELAQLIAITPPYLSELFSQLERDHILRRDKGWLIIPDPQKLWHTTEFEGS